MRRRRHRSGVTRGGPVRLVVVVLLVGLCGGCLDRQGDAPRSRTTSSAQEPAGKSGTGKERRELEPLTKRFPELGEPDAATWYSGTLGRADVPGPSSYWIDAVVQLSASDLDTLAAAHDLAEAADDPDVVDELADEVPPGPLVAGPGLDRALGTSGFSSRAWLDPERGLLVLTAKGQ